MPNYWLLDAYERTLKCLVLKEGTYQMDQRGESHDEIHPSLFPGLVLPLKRLWGA